MSRSSFQEMLPTYADGELDPAQAALVEEELRRDPALRDELVRWKKLRECCRRVACCGDVPGELESRLRSQLSINGRALRWRRYLSTAGLAAAAVILAAVAIPRVSNPGGGSAGGASTASAIPVSLSSAEPFVKIYRGCAKNHHDAMHLKSPCPVSATQVVRQALVEQNRSCKAFVPDLRSAGWQLDGICMCFPRIDCPKGINVVHAFYRRVSDSADEPGEILSVFSCNRCVKVGGCGGAGSVCESKRSYEHGEFDGVSLVKWDESGTSFALCSELPVSALEGIAESVKVAARMDAAPPVASGQR